MSRSLTFGITKSDHCHDCKPTEPVGISELDRCDVLDAIGAEWHATPSEPGALADALDAIHGWALDFASDCEWREEDAESIADLAPGVLVRNAARHYDGGMAALVRDALANLATDTKPSAEGATRAAKGIERYVVEYRDARGRWHRARGSYALASHALAIARQRGQRCDCHGWRVLDAEGNHVAASLKDGEGAWQAVTIAKVAEVEPSEDGLREAWQALRADGSTRMTFAEYHACTAKQRALPGCTMPGACELDRGRCLACGASNRDIVTCGSCGQSWDGRREVGMPRAE